MLLGQNEYGHWWATTAKNSNEAYTLRTDSSTAYPLYYTSKTTGLTLRFPSTPPAQPKPAGIRFRIYIQESIDGGMALWVIKAQPVPGGLHRPILTLMLTMHTQTTQDLAHRIT
ncbi:hypothetical protein IJG78_01315 [Candidatus Saccharibacteria bacterium]|nr:hypothetical protein [Candidatus Saccharibacteria bacterium]